MLTREEIDDERMSVLNERKRYVVTVTMKFTYETSARDEDQAEDEAYDEIKQALRGSYLDYEFYEFDTEEKVYAI